MRGSSLTRAGHGPPGSVAPSGKALKLASLAALVGIVVTGLPAMQVPAAGWASENFALTSDGRPRARLTWWSSRGGDSGRFPAAELQRYVKRMSGARLPLQPAAGMRNRSPRGLAGVVVIRPGVEGSGRISAATLASLAATLRTMPPDSFVIRPVGEKIFLAGSTRRSVLYATYEVLERLGARFLAPNFVFYRGHGELVPRDRTLVLGRVGHTEKPSFRYRRKYVEEAWSHTPRTLKKLVDWMAKARLNVLVHPHDHLGLGLVKWRTVRKALIPELVKRGIVLESGGHGYNSFLPKWRYQGRHPDWFSPGANVFNITNRQALRTYTDNVVYYLAQHPEIRIFDAWPPDMASWPKHVIQRFGTVADAQTFVENHLRSAITKQLPRFVRLEQIAYKAAQQVPEGERAYGRTTIVDVAPYGRSYAEPIFSGSNSANTEFRDLLTRWRKAHRGPLALYEYYVKYVWHSLPVALPALISQEIPFYKDRGATGIGIFSEPANWIPYEVNHLWTAAWSWDAGLDPDAFLASYLEKRYGPAAPDMRAYLEHVQNAGQAIWDGPNGNYKDPVAVSQAMLEYTRAAEALDSAAAVARSVGSRLLIQKLRANATFAIADTEISFFTVSGNPEAAAEAKVRTKELVERYRLSGTILQNLYLMRRYAEGPHTRGNTRWLYDFYRRHW